MKLIFSLLLSVDMVLDNLYLGNQVDTVKRQNYFALHFKMYCNYIKIENFSTRT